MSTAEPGEPRVRRWEEQRWLIDNVIRSNGLEWDQPRLQALLVSLGAEASGDVAAVRARVQKLADIPEAFAAVARRRQARAEAAQRAGEEVTARENWYMAANFWASAQWSIDVSNDRNRAFNAAKRACFEAYASLADHPVVAAWIPFRGAALPAWLHLPKGASGKVPCVVSVPGMDGYKERSVALYGDPLLERGMAVLAIEGPGQYEAALLGIHVDIAAWTETGRAAFDYLAARPDIDATRIAIAGRSFGTMFATIALAHEPRFIAGAILATCLEPGCQTIFEEASPTYKKRFMWMAGFTDELAFDAFCPSLTWEGHAEQISCPFLCLAGEADELSPLCHTERMMQLLRGQKRLVVYQDSRHSVGGVPSVVNGPSPAGHLADWLAVRTAAKPFPSERWFVSASGAVEKTAY